MRQKTSAKIIPLTITLSRAGNCIWDLRGNSKRTAALSGGGIGCSIQQKKGCSLSPIWVGASLSRGPGLRVGRRTIHGASYETSAPDAADYLITIDFDDISGLQAYLRHPAHEELGARFGQSLSSAFVYDFEVGGIEELSRLV